MSLFTKNKIFLGNLAACLLLICFWMIASSLRPDPRGFGTHEQLFLPPCFFKLFTHIPCPACGLTTSFAYLMKGNLTQSFKVNAVGPLIFLSMIALSIHSLISLIKKRNFWNFIHGKKTSFVSIVLVIGLIVNWCSALLLNHNR